MLQLFIVAIVSFVAGILVGAGAYCQYCNRLYMKYPEFFRTRLNLKIANRHTCHHAFDAYTASYCRKPASNQCMECKGWFCDEHFYELTELCDVDSELKAVKEQ